MTIEDACGGTTFSSMLMTSSSPSPSPVRLSPWCSIDPSGDLRLLKKTNHSSERILWLSPSANALASRSKSSPAVDRTSQPRPTAIAARFGAALVRLTFPPLLKLTPMVGVTPREFVAAFSRHLTSPPVEQPTDRSHPAAGLAGWSTESVDRRAVVNPADPVEAIA